MPTATEALDLVTGVLLGLAAGADERLLRDEELLSLTASVEAVGRLADALRLRAAGEIAFRSRTELGSDRLSAKKGCRTGVELLARVSLVSEHTASRRMRLGEAIRPRLALSGDTMPAPFEHLNAGVRAGDVGLDAAAAIVEVLDPVRGRVGDARLEAAEEALVAAASGPTPESAVPCTADEVRGQARVWAHVLDEDGAMPAEERAMRARGISAGTLRDGVVRRTMSLLPEIDAAFEAVLNAFLNPRSKPSFAEHDHADAPKDPRATAQARHDIFASLVDGVSRSGGVPSVGGAAPTVLVSVRQSDLTSGTGAGFVDGAEAPLSMRAVRQYICGGGHQRVVFGDNGAVISLGSPERCFTAAQRRAIGLRDGGCVIPGCSIPAAWSEVHHVEPHHAGGETDVCNGVLLCWFHHRTIENSGWRIGMIGGVPHVKPPPWLRGGRTEAETPWRRATTSRSQLADILERLQRIAPSAATPAD